MRNKFYKAVALVSACAVAFSSNGLTTFAAEAVPESVESEEILLDEVLPEEENGIIPEDSAETVVSEDETIEENEEAIDGESDEVISEEADGDAISEATDESEADETLLGENEEPDDNIRRSGNVEGIDWYITYDNELFLSGEGDINYRNIPWEDDKNKIVKATVNIKGATSLAYMFDSYYELTEADLSGLDTSEVTSMSHMFKECSSLLTVDVSGFDTSKVTAMDYMFYSCRKLVYVDVSGFDTSNVTYFERMFSICPALESIDVSGFDTSKATNMSGFFAGCSSLKKIDVSSFDTRNVTDISYMFSECSSLTELDISSFSTSQCQNMTGMFKYCRNLTYLNTSHLSTASAENIDSMFLECEKLTSIDLRNFSTSHVEGSYPASGIISGCDSLKSIDMSSLDISNNKSPYFFSGLASLVEIYVPTGINVALELPRRDGMAWVNSENEIVKEIPANNTSPAFFCISESAAQNLVACSKEGDTFRAEEMWVANLDPAGYTYTRNAIKPEIEVYSGGILLTEGVDYTVSYKNNTKPASKDASKAPTLTVKGKGNYNGTIVKKFDIVKLDINDIMPEIKEADRIYPVNGKKQAPVPELFYNGYELESNKDFSVTYAAADSETGVVSEDTVSKIKAAGTYQRIITGKGNYTGTYTDTIILNETTDISKATVARIPDQKFSPNPYALNRRCDAVLPDVTVKYGGKELEGGVDYITRYSDNYFVGTGKVTIIGIGEYSGSKTATFKIKPVNMSEVVFDYVPEYLYAYNRTYNPGSSELKYNGREIRVNRDYTETVKYGDSEVTVTFKGIESAGFKGSVKKKIKIKKTDIFNSNDIHPSVSTRVTYIKGGPCKPLISIGVSANPALDEGQDYTVTYKNNKKVGTAKVTITGKGVFTGKKTYEYEIVKKNLTDTQISVSNVTYSETAGNYKTTVKIKDNNDEALVAGTDYVKTIKYFYANETTVKNKGNEVVRAAGEEANKKDIVPAGTKMYVSITSKGKNYTGTALRSYRVTAKNIASAVITVEDQTYTGRAICPRNSAVTVKVDGVKLSEGDDYIITGYSDNIATGSKAKITIKGYGDYVGTKTASFKIKKQAFDDNMWLFSLKAGN